MSSAKPRRSVTTQQNASRKRSLPAPPSGEDSSVAVAVRVRPFLGRELELSEKCVVSMRGQEAWITSDVGAQHRFVFDQAFWSFDGEGASAEFAEQQAVYEKLARPLLDRSFEGYNACLFAYGQTGSGKSYCMMGEKEDRGVIPRFGEELFERITEDQSAETSYKVEISFYEIYNERIHDLLASSKGRAKALRVREHSSLGPFVEDLSSYVASSNEDLQGWVNLGNKHRATAATGMNDKSSRSHSVFMIVLTQTKTMDEQEVCRKSRINLVDLAGSERTGKAGTTGERLKEGASINKSLHTLGKVISALCERSISRGKKTFIPYRDSTLTWLLKESLGGNSKTAMIATLSPAASSYDETLSTLRYADQARSIVNVARVNEDETSKLIRELREEIERLRSQFKNASLDASSLDEVQMLRGQLKMSEKLMSDHTRSWQEKLVEAETRKEEEADQLKKHGVSFKVDNRLPNLVNLNEDPQLSEMLLYVIKEGRTTVGQESSSVAHDIHLSGALVNEDHCVLENDDETVRIQPINTEAQTYVNGELIGDGVVLHHGDRVVIGGDHYFRFNHPVELAKNPDRRSIVVNATKDFEFARDELFEVQDVRLRAEVEEARLQANEEAMTQIAAAKELAQRELDQNRRVFEHELLSVKGQLVAESTDKREVMQRSEQKVETLEAEKRALEAQVIAHRHQLEMDRERLRKVFEEDRQQKTNLIADLENERRKLEEDVVKLKKSKEQRETLTELIKTPEKMATSTGQSKRLMRYYMMLTEANNISESLKKNTSFFIECVADGQPTHIRVQNTKLGISTIWPVGKFEQKLDKMRELFQGDGEAVDDDDLFYDPRDDWKKSMAVSPMPSTPNAIGQPRSLSKHRSVSSLSLQELPARIPKSLADLLQSAVTPSPGTTPRPSASDASPSLGRSLLPSAGSRHGSTASPGGVGVFSLTPMTQAVVSNPVKSVSYLAGVARQHVSAMLDIFPSEGLSSTTVADRVVAACCDIRKAAVDVQVAFQKVSSGTVTVPVQESLQYAMLSFSTACQCLVDNTAAWKRLEQCRRAHDHTRRNPHMLKAMDGILSKLQREARTLSSNIVRLLQGVENDIDTVVRDGTSNILAAIASLVRLAGKASLATAQSPQLTESALDTDATSPEASLFDSLSLFLCGAAEYVELVVRNMKAAIAEGHRQIAELREANAAQLTTQSMFLDGTSSMLSGVKSFLDSIQLLQTKLSSCSSSGVSFSYHRAETLLAHLSLLHTDLLALPRLTSKSLATCSESGGSPSASSVEKLVNSVQALVLHTVDAAAACKPQLPSSIVSPLSPTASLGSQGSDSELSETGTVASSSASSASMHSLDGEDPAHAQALADFLPAIQAAAKDVARAAKSLSNLLKRVLRGSSPTPPSQHQQQQLQQQSSDKSGSPTVSSGRKSVGSSSSSSSSAKSVESPQQGPRQRRQLPSLDNVLKDNKAPAQAGGAGSPGAPGGRQRASLGSTTSPAEHHPPGRRRLPRSPSTPALEVCKKQDLGEVEQEV